MLGQLCLSVAQRRKCRYQQPCTAPANDVYAFGRGREGFPFAMLPNIISQRTLEIRQ